LKKLAPFIFVFLSINALSQVNGTRSYRFLDIPMTARASANGGSSMPMWGDDINLLHSNPASLNPGMLKQVAFNYCNYVSDINQFSLAYAHSLKQYGTAGITMQAFSYGDFMGYDEFGQQTVAFKANDYSINLHYAKPMADSMFNIGVALKTIISQYENYQSVGNAIDFGIMYRTKNNLTASLVARNVGVMWQSYTSVNNSREPILNTVQFGMSKKVDKAPFRIFFVYDQLLRWNLRYVSPIDTAGRSNSFANTSAIDSTGFQRFSVKTRSFADNFMRHMTIGTEILLTKNFNLRIAYSYRRQTEMALPEQRSASGLSFGFNFSVKRFGFSYGFAKMSAPGNSHVIGVTLGL